MIYNTILDTIGNTPLVKLNKVTNNSLADVLVKIESFNPAGSVKDRTALSMLNDAEEKGLITKDTLIVEPTSGNTGIGLAMACAVKGYKLILTMPASMSEERRKILALYGAELVLTDADGGMTGAIDEAERIFNTNKNCFIPMQFKNPANPEIHRKTTALEIWNDTDGKIDIFVACAGTGGTITGTSEILKKYNYAIKCIAIEPASSPVLSGGKPGKHKIPGTGPGFVPDIVNREIIDEIISVSDNDALEMAKTVAKTEGIFGGISSGAAIWGALQVAQRKENKNKLVVVILPDDGNRYLSEF